MAKEPAAATRRTTTWPITVAGFCVPVVLLVAVVTAFANRAMWGAGWRGGEWLYAFVGISLGALVAGSVARWFLSRTRWAAFAVGVAYGGLFGVVMLLTGAVVLWTQLDF